MSRLLSIYASPRKDRSHSRAVADAFVQAYRASHPEDEILALDLFETDLPPVDGAALDAKYKILGGQPHTDEEKQAWRRIEAVIEQFQAADKYVMAVPMWNFGIPYRLKHYFDVLVQPGYTFSFSPQEGYTGLVTGKPILLAYASGGDYSEGSGREAYDLRKIYLEAVLHFLGFTTIHRLTVQPTLMGGPDAAAARREGAIAEARKIAPLF